MGLDRQLEQLCGVYAEKSDDELLALHEQREDLTDIAQQALAQVMRERKLSPTDAAPVIFPNVAQKSHFPGPLVGDEVEIMTFRDALQAKEAIRNIEEAEIAHRMVDWNALESGGAGSGWLRLGLIVRQADAAHAKQVLQETMQLFPLKEGNDSFDPYKEFAAVSLGSFERKGALLVAHALGSAGVSYIWTDGQEDPHANDSAVEIEVNGPRLEYARQVAQAAFRKNDN